MTQAEAAQVPAAATGWEDLRQQLRQNPEQPDPLLDCLVEVTRLLGQPRSRAALSAGLPLGPKGMTPSVFARSAARAGLATRVVRRTLAQLDAAVMPIVLLLNGEQAAVLVGWDQEGQVARLLLPETGQGEVTLPVAELEQRYTGMAISVRPRFRFDARAPELHARREGHWFWTAMGEQASLYRDILGAALLINLFALALPLFTMNVYDRVVPNFAEGTLWMLAVGLGLVIVLDYTVRMVRGHFVDLAGSRIDVRLSAQIMERVLGMRLKNRPASVGAYAVTLRSFETVRDFIASATITAIIDVPFAVLFLLVMGWISWYLVLVPLVCLVGVVIYAWSVQGKMARLAETTFRAAATRNATLVEALTGLETIKAHGAERVMQTRLEATSVFLAATSARLRLMSSSVVNVVSGVQQVASLLLIVVGVYLIREGQITMGGLIASTMLSGRALGPMTQLVALMMQYENARAGLTSLDSTMQAPQERSPDATYLHRPQLGGQIAFENVHFAYPGSKQPVLRGINLRIAAGEHVVIIGRVGSGKTTLQRLIMGLHTPDEGTVKVDGVDLRQIDPADLRRNIGYVSQDPVLFFGSLRDNIAIAAPDADGHAVLAAAEIAGLGGFISAHPQGFDMMVGERGESLSGGQRQAVAIARAVLLEPAMLVMDEPTGSMDFSSEAQFKERLRTFSQGRTLIVVTHRSSLLDLADRIVVLDEGRIVADGPRDQVLADLKAGRVGKAS